jgi:hypothetical protein
LLFLSVGRDGVILSTALFLQNKGIVEKDFLDISAIVGFAFGTGTAASTAAKTSKE